jgi:hypothetical protein
VVNKLGREFSRFFSVARFLALILNNREIFNARESSRTIVYNIIIFTPTKDACNMSKHDAIYLPDFDSNTRLMASCPNGPGPDYDCTNYVAEENISQNDLAYYQAQERQGDLYQAYGSEVPFQITPKQ